jgi:hypothetical protein
MSITLNGLRVTHARVIIPWRGVWSAEIECELTPAGTPPSGPAALVVNDWPLVGTIDPERSGRFGDAARVRVLGGGGGWHKPVAARQYHNDAGVLSTAVLASTGAEVGERVTEAGPPSRLGVDYMRGAGPASRVLEGRSWWVDPSSGTTIVGPRPHVPAPPDLTIVSWDPTTRVAVLSADRLVFPGAMLTSATIGSALVRDVEHVLSGDGGVQITAWCHDAEVARLPSLLASVAREACGVPYLKVYRYRIVMQGGDGRVTLQAVAKAAGMPEVIKLVDVWPGMASVSAKYAPGTVCLVEFIDGDPTRPVVRGFEPGAKTLEVSVDAVRFAVGLGAQPVALAPPTLGLITAIAGQLKALSTLVAAMTGPPGAAVPPFTNAHATAAATIDTAMTTFLAGLPTSTTAATSTKTWSD